MVFNNPYAPGVTFQVGRHLMEAGYNFSCIYSVFITIIFMIIMQELLPLSQKSIV